VSVITVLPFFQDECRCSWVDPDVSCYYGDSWDDTTGIQEILNLCILHFGDIFVLFLLIWIHILLLLIGTLVGGYYPYYLYRNLYYVGDCSCFLLRFISGSL
jgi:hypothetical protein